MAGITVRRSQTLSPFGVGAILDVMGESLVAEDITRWKDGATTPVDARRLAALLRVDELRMPPASTDRVTEASPGVPYFRFPQYLFCGSCRRIQRWSTKDEKFDKAPTCRSCGTGRKHQLIPMRFVMICGNGHLDDVDWVAWAHRSAGADRERRQCQDPSLRFEQVPGVGGGLESIRVRCVTCKGPGVTLKGITAKKFRCRGRQPWQFSADTKPCDAEAVVVQRGASNVHFPWIQSAIDIPPDSDWENYGSDAVAVRNHAMFKVLLGQDQRDDLYDVLIDRLATEVGMAPEEIEVVLAGQRGGPAAQPAGVVDDDSDAGLRAEEYLAFLQPRHDQDHRNRFITRHVDLPTAGTPGPGSLVGTLGRLDRLVLVTRLREVRALRGFYRFDQQQLVPPDLGAGLKWLPAVESYGEGIFLTLDPDQVAEWEQRPEVVGRAAALISRMGKSFHARWLQSPTPRLVLLHTLAHVLIRQLTYSAGYSSASLRERIYSATVGPAGGGMSGLLVYTTAGDAEGTLGGLVRQGEPDHLLPVLVVALQQAQWCSLDPICRESSGQGTDSLSLAACHACALVSETSCEQANVLLDRTLLVDPTLGFFGPVMGELARWQMEVTD